MYIGSSKFVYYVSQPITTYVYLSVVAEISYHGLDDFFCLNPALREETNAHFDG